MNHPNDCRFQKNVLHAPYLPLQLPERALNKSTIRISRVEKLLVAQKTILPSTFGNPPTKRTSQIKTVIGVSPPPKK